MKKKGFIAPVIVLTVICIVISGLLAYVNSITDPIIKEASALAEENAKKEVLPEADSFTEVELKDEYPKSLNSAFIADNGAGIVFKLTGAGYGGDMQIMVGIGSDGKIRGTKVLSHSETAGLGARVAGEDFNKQFTGADKLLEGVDVISGSTISSNCFINMVKAAYDVYDILQEGGY